MENNSDENENDPPEENIAYSTEIKNGGLKLKIKFNKNTTGSKKSKIEVLQQQPTQNQQYLPAEVPNTSGPSELLFVPNEVPPSTSLHEVSATLPREAPVVPNETTFMEIFHAASTSTVNTDSRFSFQNSSVLSYNSESDRNSSIEILNSRSLSPQPGPSGLQRSSNTSKGTLLQELSIQIKILLEVHTLRLRSI